MHRHALAFLADGLGRARQAQSPPRCLSQELRPRRAEQGTPAWALTSGRLRGRKARASCPRSGRARQGGSGGGLGEGQVPAPRTRGLSPARGCGYWEPGSSTQPRASCDQRQICGGWAQCLQSGDPPSCSEPPAGLQTHRNVGTRTSWCGQGNSPKPGPTRTQKGVIGSSSPLRLRGAPPFPSEELVDSKINS